MRNVSVSLTDRHAAAIEAELASGDYASVSEVIRAALREFFDRPPGPPLDRIEADIARHRAGTGLNSAAAARARVAERLAR
jgi:putative addiction module CopG family antidote